MKKRRVLLSVLGLAAVSALGGVDFDTAAKTFNVTTYPEDYPCHPRLLLETSERQGWNAARRDPSSGAIVLDASLVIGATGSPTSTFFQIGGADAPNETLIVNGDVYVSPDEPAIPPRKKTNRVNRLTLGSPADAKIHPTLRTVGGALYAGQISPKWYSGQLRVYNGAVDMSGATFRPGATVDWSVYDLVLKNARISGVAAPIRGWLSSIKPVIEDTTFERCAAPISAYQAVNGIGPKRCVFRDCDTALDFPYGRFLRLENCVFKNNRRNWSMRNMDYLELVDCDIDTPREGNVYKREKTGYFQKFPHWRGVAISRRHVVVEALDASGAPVPNALIETFCPFENTPLVAVTGKDGKTPAADAPGALSLVEWREGPAEKSETPEKKAFAYELRVSVAGRPAVVLPAVRATRSAVVRVVIAPEKAR